MEIGRSQGRYGGASPTVAPRSGSYKPASGGGSRTVVVVPDDIAKLLPKDAGADVNPQQIEKMRAVVKKRYGEAVANTAFREIDYRQTKVKCGIKGFIGQTSAKAIKDHHLTTAALRALEMASLNVGARAVKQRSETILANLEPQAAELRLRLKDKQDELDRVYSEHVPGSYSFMDTGSLRGEIAKLEGQIKDLDQAIDEAKKDLQSTTQTITDYQNNPLDATAFGKAQRALAKVDDDPKDPRPAERYLCSGGGAPRRKRHRASHQTHRGHSPCDGEGRGRHGREESRRYRPAAGSRGHGMAFRDRGRGPAAPAGQCGEVSGRSPAGADHGQIHGGWRGDRE